MDFYNFYMVSHTIPMGIIILKGVLTKFIFSTKWGGVVGLGVVVMVVGWGVVGPVVG